MKTIIVKTAVLGGCVMALTACGGGTTTNPPPVVTTPSYETLTSTAAKTSTLAGTAIQINNTSDAVTRVDTTGSLTHNTGAMTVNDGTYTLTDADGFDAAGVLNDGAGGTFTSDGTQGFTGTYDYVAAYEQSYTSGGTSYTSSGIGGVVTSSGDVPTAGTATYTGEATGQIVTATTGTDLNNGTSTVTANFGSGTVDVTMTGFSAEDQATGATTTAPIDTITATGMTIAGNAFSGGTFTTTNGGAIIDVTGANATGSGSGNFFGYDATNSIPDETGGIILLQGDSGTVAAGFIAD